MKHSSLLLAFGVLAGAASIGHATIIGFGQLGGSNTSIPSNLASNATADGSGYVVTNGVTPNITLLWDGQWDIHTSSWFNNLENKTVGGGDWDNEGGSPRVGQLDIDFHTITFEADAGYAVVLNSFDFVHTQESSGTTVWNLMLTNSKGSVVWSETLNMNNASTSTSVVTVEPEFTGELGESYTLTFDLTSQTYGSNGRHAIDNLSFNQYPDPAAEASLAHYYLFDGDATDALGVADLTANGDAVEFIGSDGAVGGYVSLGGSDDFLLADLSQGSELSILGDYSVFRPFSLAFWIRQNPAQAADGIDSVWGMSTDSTSPDTFETGFEVASRHESERALFAWQRNGETVGEIATGQDVVTGEWRHVVVVFLENTRFVYLDGELVGSDDAGVAITTNPLRYFTIGALLQNGAILHDFHGDVDDFQVYTGRIDDTQALQLYQNPGRTLDEDLPDPVVDPNTELADLVDVWIGAIGAGSCPPGACLPQSSIYPSPNTDAAASSGYAAGSSVVGFAQIHATGAGSSTLSYGNFLVSPRIGLDIDEDDHASVLVDAEAHPYSFKGTLSRWGIDFALAPTANTAIYEFEFPASTDARINFDVARKLGSSSGMRSGSLEIDLENGTISGGGEFDGNWNPAAYNLYFYAKVDRTPTSGGSWIGSSASEGVLTASTATRQRLGGWLTFDTTEDEVVRLKIAVSFDSVAKAQQYLENENAGWDFDAVEAAAKAAWNDALGTVATPNISQIEARLFYTALYHSLIQPRDRTGDPAGWPADAPFWDDQYTLWDTWITLYPLLAIVRPESVAANVNSFAERFERNGVAETAFIQGKDYQVGQGGDEVDRVIADAFVKQIEGIDWEKVWDLLEFNASRRTPEYRNLGYVATDGNANGYDFRLASASSTLGFAHGDWCASLIAESLGYSTEAELLRDRSENWRNVWDESAASDGFTGFIKARSSNGTFDSSAATSSSGFYQGTSWNYSFNVPHQRDELVELMGGRARFIQRLEFALAQGNGSYIDYTNEPGFQTTFLFGYAHRPYLTSYWASQLRLRYGDYGYPGDEDSGAMSSLYFFTTAGFFPMATQDVYYLHGPRIPEVSFHASNGNVFTILAENAGGENYYIQSAKLNDETLDEAVVHHADFTDGSTLELVMGAYPNAWGTGADFQAPTNYDDSFAVEGEWASALGSAPLTGAETDSPSWGGSTDSARSSAVFAPFEEVVLNQAGATLTLTAQVSFSGLTGDNGGSAENFAWGLFSGAEGSHVWSGYLAVTDGVDDAGTSALFSKSSASGQAFYNRTGASQLATFSLPKAPIEDGDYRLIMTLSWSENSTMDYYAALIRESDGVLLSAFTGSDSSPNASTFNRVGFRVGNNLDADTVTISDCTIYTSNLAELAPVPQSNTVTAEVNASALSGYAGDLNDYVTDPDGDTLYYTKVSGPDWLVVNPDGSLSGKPDFADVGTSVFVISVTDNEDGSASFTLNIVVDEAIEVLRAPLPSLGDALRFGVIPDTQGTTNGVPVDEANAVALKLIELAPSFVIEVGDVTDGNSSGDSKLSQLELLKTQMVTPLRNSGIEYYPVRGNHDSLASSLTSSLSWVWQAAFPWLFEGAGAVIDPTDVPGGSVDTPNYKNYSYVFDTGANTFMIALDEWDGGTDTNYSEWITAKLAEIRSEHPDAHIFPFSHTGLFAMALHPAMTEYISTGPEPFIEACAEYQIDGWLAGHNHIYDRSMAVDLDNDARSEFFYITCGSASEKFYSLSRLPADDQRLNHLVDSTHTEGEPIAFQIIEINGDFVTMHNWMTPEHDDGSFTEWSIWDTYTYSRNGGQYNVAAQGAYNDANIIDTAPDKDGFVGTSLRVADGTNSDATYYTVDSETFGLYRNITIGWVKQSQWYDAEGVELASDIASIHGMRNDPVRNRCDAYTLSLSYDDSELSASQEAQLNLVAFIDADDADSDPGDWVNAASVTLGQLIAEPVFRSPSTDDAVGVWGVDAANNVVWARLDYQGDFAIASNAVDSDSDGLEDAWEIANFGSLVYDADDDVDGDGLNNLDEQKLHTSPTLADSDGDLFNDGVEYQLGLDPTVKDTDLRDSLLDALRDNVDLQTEFGLFSSSTIVGLAGDRPVIQLGDEGQIQLKLQLLYSPDLHSWEAIDIIEVEPDVDTDGAGFFMWSPDTSDAVLMQSAE
ncbi:GH92 family glycosyl hydrolase [Cerasicoccus frondis]|uniref:GH92 family glycosyl hydrolase n=1 Tax=Cerasicoccus frondis TaxID=490090 RepID=UPI00285253C0|nr:GH92 family glycosyl hydrolase [Cerasicoccus frondis]